jgi:hypothetical protein
VSSTGVWPGRDSEPPGDWPIVWARPSSNSRRRGYVHQCPLVVHILWHGQAHDAKPRS